MNMRHNEVQTPLNWIQISFSLQTPHINLIALSQANYAKLCGDFEDMFTGCIIETTQCRRTISCVIKAGSEPPSSVLRVSVTSGASSFLLKGTGCYLLQSFFQIKPDSPSFQTGLSLRTHFICYVLHVVNSCYG